MEFDYAGTPLTSHANFGLSLSKADSRFLEVKFQDRRLLTSRMALLMAPLALSLWLWDLVVDPAGAPQTLAPRILLALCAIMASLWIGHRKVAVSLARAFILGMPTLCNLIFFHILRQLDDGMSYGIGGYMFFQLLGFLVCSGLSLRLIVAYHLLHALLPHLLGLAFPGAGFLHAHYAVLLWPAAILSIAAQYVLYREYCRSYCLRKALQQQAATDPLTGTMNRRAFQEAAKQSISLAQRHRRPIALLLLDADHFKRINDSYGHAVGDQALQELARVIKGISRASDMFCRWGGEEFAGLLPATDAQGALETSRRLLAAIRQRSIRLDDGRLLRFTASIGVASLEHADENLDQLISKADAALYRAKSGGRDQAQLGLER